LLAEEPGLSGADARPAFEELGVIGGFAGVALHNARVVRAQARWLLASAADRVYRSADGTAALIEARRLLDGCARSLALTPGERERARHALNLGEWARTEDGRRELELLCDSDASGLVRGTRSLIDAVAGWTGHDDDRLPVLLVALEAYRAARTRGIGVEQAIERAHAKAAVDPFVADCLVANVASAIDPELDAA